VVSVARNASIFESAPVLKGGLVALGLVVNRHSIPVGFEI